jgi:putative hemolysin
MVAIPHTATLKDLIEVFNKSHFSRIPVYRGSMDKVVGVLYVKDAIDYLAVGKINTPVRRIMRKPYFVPPTKTLDNLLREFQSKHVHIAIVTGGYGEILGLVTIEDLLEELVGEIVDELEVKKEVQRLDGKTIRVEGRTELAVINSVLGINLTSKNYDTIAGLILEHLDRIPRKNEELQIGRARITVEGIIGPKIIAVKITKV